jgi:oxygen-independent coproporphyrinogen-3 oxidase
VRETEDLTTEEKYHDYLITALRTRWGADPAFIEAHFGQKFSDYFLKKCDSFLEVGSLEMVADRVIIPPDHWLIADHILRELF